MVTAISDQRDPPGLDPIRGRRSRPRLGLGAGLTAAARGLAFTGLMLAGLGLLLVIVVAVGLTALGCGVLIIGNAAPTDQRILQGFLAVGAGLALGRFGVPL